MLRFLADENFNNKIVQALLRQDRNLDLIRVQDVGLSGADDETILKFAILEKRILITHDVKTITKLACDRMAKGENISGIIEIVQAIPIRAAVEDILLISDCSFDDEWDNQIIYLPFR